MNLIDCINFANENKLCFLATVENDQPRVRALQPWFADESGFYFQTGSQKSFYQQLNYNSKTEICFYKNGSSLSSVSTMRISGKVEFLNDRKLKEKVIIDRPFLKNFGLSADNPALIIFRISHGQAHFWTRENNLKPKEIITF
jgi:uncharacterized pyridoxamine 5'-phosphate oxidase family protein